MAEHLVYDIQLGKRVGKRHMFRQIFGQFVQFDVDRLIHGRHVRARLGVHIDQNGGLAVVIRQIIGFRLGHRHFADIFQIDRKSGLRAHDQHIVQFVDFLDAIDQQLIIAAVDIQIP
ncbi:hypothetical protein D1872_246890 [compost metagenome]